MLGGEVGDIANGCHANLSWSHDMLLNEGFVKIVSMCVTSYKNKQHSIRSMPPPKF